MDRREFCRSALVASVAGSIPWISGCEPGTPGASVVDTGIAALSLDGAEIELEAAAVRELGESLTGRVILSDHSEYNTARMLWNGMHDRHPALIVRCLNAQDVSQAVTFARERELLTAVVEAQWAMKKS